MAFTRTVLLAALLLAVASHVSAGTRAIDLDLEQQRLLNGTDPANDSCGGNCPGGNCKSCPCGLQRNPVNIANW